MWLSSLKTCGCPSQPEYVEENIEFIPYTCKVSLPDINDNKICELKCKVIKELFDIIDKLKCGIQPDLELLLQEISLIYINDGGTILFK